MFTIISVADVVYAKSYEEVDGKEMLVIKLKGCKDALYIYKEDECYEAYKKQFMELKTKVTGTQPE